jgi:alpha/beta superfamily hydrolase
MVLPSGVTRLAGSDTTDPAGLRGTVSVLEIRGPSGKQAASVDGNGERLAAAAIPAVEGTHMRDTAHRAIAGFSMGGYGAVKIAMRNQGAFGQVVSIATMTALRQAFTFLTAGWRQAAADDAADSGFWNAVAAVPSGSRPR